MPTEVNNPFQSRLVPPKRPMLVIAVLGLFVWFRGATGSAETFDLATANLADIQAAMDSGALTSEKLVQLYLNRIEAYDKKGPKLNSMITVNPRALEEARALDAERKLKGPRSQLHGVPVVFKDLIDVAGLPTTAGFVPFGSPVPARDATIVARLRQAGAVMLGKASTANWFGNSDDTHPNGGAPLNPYNVRHSPGATSNGSAVSLAANLTALAIGTDTSASVQHPAANSSVVGFVATQGMVSRAGIIPRGATQDRAGAMARSVYDVAALFSVIAGWDAEDLITFRAMGHFPQDDWSKRLDVGYIQGKRIGVLREMIYEGPQHEPGRAIFERALEDLREAGAYVIDPVLTGIDLKKESLGELNRTAEYEKTPFTDAYLARLGEASKFKSVKEMIESVGPDKFSRGMVTGLDLPAPDESPDYLARYRARDMFIRLIHDTMDKFALDALVLPYRTYPPEPIDGPRPPESTNNLTSHTGLPAVIVPGGYTDENLPIGIQFFGRHNTDLMILQIAYGYEQATHRRKAPAIAPPLAGDRFDY
jgi:Asp-tRNA(Asn)/Glu-tRNA(Gln) amidotransferase A subunit family amidase